MKMKRREITQLQPRQLEILGRLAQGKTTHEAAAEMGLEFGTVKNHLNTARRMVGCRTTYRLMALYVERYGIDK